MKTSLVVMAAGMGSRFGGLKQMEPITEAGQGLLDFTVYDAKAAGFDRVVFIVRESMLQDFRKLVGDRIAKTILVDYVLQDDSLLPPGRTKPLGTGHAIYCCRSVIKEPFVIVNADDYYGHNAFTAVHDHLVNAEKGQYAMLAYALGNTLSKNGTVARGVCTVENDFLAKVTEITKIAPDGACEMNSAPVVLPFDTPVSMNLWALTPDIFDFLEKEFNIFLRNADLMKEEFYIPSVISRSIDQGYATVRVYRNTDKWYGITYREDLDEVKQAIGGYIRDGLYPAL